jgi:hypothetical protein
MELTNEDRMLHMPIEIISWVASMAFPSAKREQRRHYKLLNFEASYLLGNDTVV